MRQDSGLCVLCEAFLFSPPFFLLKPNCNISSLFREGPVRKSKGSQYPRSWIGHKQNSVSLQIFNLKKIFPGI